MQVSIQYSDLPDWLKKDLTGYSSKSHKYKKCSVGDIPKGFKLIGASGQWYYYSQKKSTKKGGE